MHSHDGDGVVDPGLDEIDVLAKWLVAEDHLRPCVETIEQKVGLRISAPVAIDHVHLIGTAGKESRDDGVHVENQVLSALGVTVLVIEFEGLRIVLTAQTLHVVKHENSKDPIRVGGGRLENEGLLLRWRLLLHGRRRIVAGSEIDREQNRNPVLHRWHLLLEVFRHAAVGGFARVRTFRRVHVILGVDRDSLSRVAVELARLVRRDEGRHLVFRGLPDPDARFPVAGGFLCFDSESIA